MHLGITSDSNADSGVGEVIDEISGPTERHFVPRDYGVGLAGIFVVLMCRDPARNFKRRVRFARKEKTVFMDVMLDLAVMREADHDRRKQIIRERLIDEIPGVVRKYKIEDFDLARFVEDLKTWLGEIGGTPAVPARK